MLRANTNMMILRFILWTDNLCDDKCYYTMPPAYLCGGGKANVYTYIGVAQIYFLIALETFVIYFWIRRCLNTVAITRGYRLPTSHDCKRGYYHGNLSTFVLQNISIHILRWKTYLQCNYLVRVVCWDIAFGRNGATFSPTNGTYIVPVGAPGQHGKKQLRWQRQGLSCINQALGPPRLQKQFHVFHCVPIWWHIKHKYEWCQCYKKHSHVSKYVHI